MQDRGQLGLETRYRGAAAGFVRWLQVVVNPLQLLLCVYFPVAL